MRNPFRRLRRKLPYRQRGLKKLVPGDSADAPSASVPSLLAEAQAVLMEVSEGRIACAEPTPPRARPRCTPALLPDDFAARQEANIFHHRCYVITERDIRPATEVRDVDNRSPARFKHSVRVFEHSPNQVKEIPE